MSFWVLRENKTKLKRRDTPYILKEMPKKFALYYSVILEAKKSSETVSAKFEKVELGWSGWPKLISRNFSNFNR